ncbi:MAG: hypothetical protein ABIG61_03755 [Planctomycetota bacterium]
MRPTENIENLVKKLRYKTDMDTHERVFSNVLIAAKKQNKQKPAEHQPDIWRLIMNKPVTKLATVAAVLLIIASAVTILDHIAKPAYAIEQTIKAFEKVNSVYVEAILREKGTLLNAKMWARRGSNGKFFFGDFQQESGNNGYTIIANESENRTYYYDPSAKRVRIFERLNVTIGDFLDSNYFLYLQQEMQNVELEYGKDKITGKEVVILKYRVPIPSKYDKSVAKSEVITFDLETKLPIRWTSWDNPDFKGEPFSDWTLISFNPELPENTFKFEIPNDATVIRE